MSQLIKTKLCIPQPRSILVLRPQLIKRLDAGLDHKLVLISAPAGYGKTTLLSEWATCSSLHDHMAWLSLDAGDNDLGSFLNYLVAALQRIEPDLGQNVASMLQPPRPSSTTTILTTLINEIADLAHSIVLVLDDYHVIVEQLIHDALSFLLDHMPPQLHLVIASRADPPLPIAHLRGQTQLTELRAVNLCFSIEQVAEFLNRVMGLTLAPEEIAVLTERTEGWIAGLQIAAMSMQGQKDLAHFIKTFSGSNRHILDYLLAEIFERQPESIQSFLMQTCILDRLSGSLCNAVTGRSDSQAVLEQLERANLFIVPLDENRSWYRYHNLLVEPVHQRLMQLDSARVPFLHRRASEWYAQNEFPTEAIEHALSSNDVEHAANLIEQFAQVTLMHSQIATLLQWLRRLPETLIRARPTLCIYYAWALLYANRPMAEINARLQDAGAVMTPGAVSAEAMACRAMIANIMGDARTGLEMSQRALELLPAENLFLRNIATTSLGMAWILNGNMEAATEAFEASIRFGQKIGNIMSAVGALCNLAGLYQMQGQLERAATLFRRALDLATDAQGRRLPVAGRALLGLGELSRESNDLDAADRFLNQSIGLFNQYGEIGTLASYLHLARVKQAQRDVVGANEMIRRAEQLALGTDTQLDDLLVKTVQAHLWLQQGNIQATESWVKERGLDAETSPIGATSSKDTPSSYDMNQVERILLARVYFVRQRYEQALEILKPLEQAAEKHGQLKRLIEILNLQALALDAQGKTDEALATLQHSLALAEPAGFFRIYVDEGKPMAGLLYTALFHNICATFISRLLVAFPELEETKPPVSSLIEPLSERELQVLELIAAGLSNREIAERLVISLSTVKGHTANVYSKLAVRGRTQAIARAKTLGLLPQR